MRAAHYAYPFSRCAPVIFARQSNAKEPKVDWQTIVAAGIAVLAGIWVGWKILSPLINEFRKKPADGGSCGGCGCGAKETNGTCSSTAVKPNRGEHS